MSQRGRGRSRGGRVRRIGHVACLPVRHGPSQARDALQVHPLHIGQAQNRQLGHAALGEEQRAQGQEDAPNRQGLQERDQIFIAAPARDGHRRAVDHCLGHLPHGFNLPIDHGVRHGAHQRHHKRRRDEHVEGEEEPAAALAWHQVAITICGDDLSHDIEGLRDAVAPILWRPRLRREGDETNGHPEEEQQRGHPIERHQGAAATLVVFVIRLHVLRKGRQLQSRKFDGAAFLQGNHDVLALVLRFSSCNDLLASE
mmetsp:Transcript_94511/g.244106  ORF Transcript_94511/g.244106 Transcript_94511/m.244106 type:complete len:256 (-) Transcript_94511:342-1109(-)